MKGFARFLFDQMEGGKMEKRGFHGRGFFSLLSFGGFLVLFITGIVLFMMPHSSVHKSVGNMVCSA